MIYPKSDSQRKSLFEAVKGILLFKSLDPGELEREETMKSDFVQILKQIEFNPTSDTRSCTCMHLSHLESSMIVSYSTPMDEAKVQNSFYCN